MAAIKLISKTREEWLENRKGGIGASEVATVLGINPWETPYQLWRRKVGLDAGKDENMAMRLGHLLEDAVAKLWAEETDNEVIASTAGDWMYVDKDKSFLRVSPDRLYWIKGQKKNAKNKGILEIKTTQKTIDEDNIPQHWFVQVQMNLGVSGFKHATIAWLTQGRSFGYKEIEFDPKFYAYLVSEVENFWVNNVLANVAPPAVSADDVMLKFPIPDASKVNEVAEQIALDCDEYKQVKAKIAELDARKDELEESIKSQFADGEAISYGGLTLATWKMGKATMKFDAKAFVAEHPEVAAQYMREQAGSRRFTVK